METTRGDGVRDNATSRDAFLRVPDARMGSLAGATDEYLASLAHELEGWLESVRQARMGRGKDDNPPYGCEGA